MGRLNSKIEETRNTMSKKKKNAGIPTYNLDGSVKRVVKGSSKVGIAVIAVVGVAIGAIYVTPLFSKTEVQANTFYKDPDPAGIKNVNDYTLDTPDEDFDEDGLTNAEEANYGTSPRRADTDGDGTTDFAELFITETSPLQVDTSLATIVEAEDNSQGNNVKTPYKIHDVVLWADDLGSKAYGGLVRTMNGYRFCNFTGWAQFPTEGYAYKINEDGVHELLEYREEENAWRIDDDSEIVIYDTPVEMVNVFSFLGKETYLEDNGLGKFLSKILPDESPFIACKRVSVNDLNEQEGNNTTTNIVQIQYDTNDFERYGKTHNLLSDLSAVYDSINVGNAVLASLNSVDNGEIIVIIYGYDENGNLLAADYYTKEPVGKIVIEERAAKQLNNKGEIIQSEWYEFKGLGFDSKLNFDRINYFAAAGNQIDESEIEAIPTEDLTIDVPELVPEEMPETEPLMEEESEITEEIEKNPEEVTAENDIDTEVTEEEIEETEE